VALAWAVLAACTGGGRKTSTAVKLAKTVITFINDEVLGE
jgi:hypothetical protein